MAFSPWRSPEMKVWVPRGLGPCVESACKRRKTNVRFFISISHLLAVDKHCKGGEKLPYIFLFFSHQFPIKTRIPSGM